MSVTEHALLAVRPGAEADFEVAFEGARHLIAASPGFEGLRLLRGIESTSTYLLIVEWDTVEAHTEGFRGSAAYDRWKSLLHHFYDPFPVVAHFAGVVDAGAPSGGAPGRAEGIE